METAALHRAGCRMILCQERFVCRLDPLQVKQVRSLTNGAVLDHHEDTSGERTALLPRLGAFEMVLIEDGKTDGGGGRSRPSRQLRAGGKHGTLVVVMSVSRGEIRV